MKASIKIKIDDNRMWVVTIKEGKAGSRTLFETRKEAQDFLTKEKKVHPAIIGNLTTGSIRIIEKLTKKQAAQIFKKMYGDDIQQANSYYLFERNGRLYLSAETDRAVVFPEYVIPYVKRNKTYLSGFLEETPVSDTHKLDIISGQGHPDNKYLYLGIIRESPGIGHHEAWVKYIRMGGQVSHQTPFTSFSYDYYKKNIKKYSIDEILSLYI